MGDRTFRQWGRCGLGLGLVAALLAAGSARSADAPAKAKRVKAADRTSAPKKPAPAGREVAVNWAKSPKASGQARLTMTNGKNLGPVLTTGRLDELLAEELSQKTQIGRAHV